MRRLFAFASVALSLSAFPISARAADPPCGAVDIRFKPGAEKMQIVVWVEDLNGKVIDTPYVTRLTGQFGLGNRPGTPLLKTDFGWPYGRREMVAPVWAHRRDHHYPKVVMGGACGNSSGTCMENGLVDNSPPTMCPGGGACGCDCLDSTIAYHSRVSTYEPFYCSPSGASKLDAMSCASKGTFAKGAYLPFPNSYSLYPPRADLNKFDPNFDSADTKDFANQNDLVAVSQATPPAGKTIDPALVWFPQNLPQGDYVACIELSQESDFNGAHNHPNQVDTVTQWDFEGHGFLGQPSIVYKVPFKYTANGYSAISTSYAGYGTWDGSDGVLHGPDNSITTNGPGTGAGRLVDVNDGMDVYRMKVVVGSCNVQPMPDMAMDADAGMSMGDGGIGPTDGGTTVTDAGMAMQSDGGSVIPTCEVPPAASNLAIAPSATSLDVAFTGPTTGAPGNLPNRFAVRYREGNTPITDTEFDRANAAPSVTATTAGASYSVKIQNLQAKTQYAVAVRGVSPCGKPSKVISAVAMTDDQKFTTLSGCFIATAAYGTEMESSVTALRAFRDRRLLSNPAGKLFVTGYYAFSRSLASVIARHPMLRAGARKALSPLVAAVTR